LRHNDSKPGTNKGIDGVRPQQMTVHLGHDKRPLTKS